MSLRVVHTFGRNAGAVESLSKDVVRFGRSPDNDVVFDPNYDRDASGHHAELRREGAAWVLVDLDSKNGTWVKGQRVSRQVILSGDEITFGAKGPRVRIEFAGAAADATTPDPKPPYDGAASGPKPRAGQAGAPVSAPISGASQVPASKNGTVPIAASPEPRPMASSHALHPHAAGPAVAAFAPAPAAARAPARAPAAAPAPARPQPQLAARAGPRPQPAQPAPVPAPPAGKRVGQRTIAMMISSALAMARPRQPQPSTAEISAYVDKQVNAATAAQKRTTGWLITLLVIAIGALTFLVIWSRKSDDEIDHLRTDLAKLPPDDPRRKGIEDRLGALHPSNASFGRNLYDRSKKGIYMLAAGGQGFCTAFAVRPSVLATNAHCVAAAKRRTGSVVALENEGRGGISFPVVDMRAHPAYRDADAHSITPDVGIVTISGKAAIVLDVASSQELSQLGAGDDVYLIGFPGRLMDVSNPAATFLSAHVGRLTGASGRPGAFAEQWLVQHDAPTTHGTSGSPIFNGRGKVVAINAGGYLERDDETVAGRKTEVVKASPYKFGMRIDLLNAILR